MSERSATRIQSYKATWNSSSLEWRARDITSSSYTHTEKVTHTETHPHRNTSTQRHIYTETHPHRDTSTQRYIHRQRHVHTLTDRHQQLVEQQGRRGLACLRGDIAASPGPRGGEVGVPGWLGREKGATGIRSFSRSCFMASPIQR